MCCTKKKNIHTEDTTSHGENKKKKKGIKKQEKKRGAEYRTRELRRYSLLVLSPTLQRHEFAQSIHATFLYPTARLPPFSMQWWCVDAVVVVITGGWCVAKKKEHTYRGHHLPWRKKKGKKQEVPSIELVNFGWSDCFTPYATAA